jgi:hypothetical protein
METDPALCHILGMAKNPKRPRDPNQLAKLIVDIATGQIEDREPTPEEQGKGRDGDGPRQVRGFAVDASVH